MTHYGTNIRMIHITASRLRALFDKIQAAGGDTVGLCDHVYCELDASNRIMPAPPEWRCRDLLWRDVGQAPPAPWQNSADLELIDWAASEGAARGLTVVIKPHVDWVRGGSRGQILPPANRRQFLAAYKRMLAPYVRIAKTHGAILCIGTELGKITEVLGAQFWITVAAWVHSQAPGLRLIYAANWGWAEDAEHKRLYPLWQSGHLIAAGIDAYYPLVPDPYTGPLDTATLQQQWHRRGIEADWCPPIDTAIEAIPQDCGGIPVWFTELGYPNLAGPGCVQTPWLAPFNGWPGDSPQAEAIRAARGRWDGVVECILFWESGHPGVNGGAAVLHDIHRTEALTRLALAGQ